MTAIKHPSGMPWPRFSRTHSGKSIKVSTRCGHKNKVKREC